MRSLHETTSALEKAIDANLGIQAELVAKLKQISEAKQKNRLQCVKIKGALDRHLKLKFNEELGNTEIATAGKITVKGYLNKLWNDNDNMKWKRRFFVDPEKSTPEPNDDEIQRRIWEGDLASGAFVHRFVPWSKIEIVTMVECAEEVREKQRKAQDEGDEKPIKDTDINFHEVAERIKDKLCSKTFTPSQMTRHTYSLTDGTVKNKHIPRSWVDYRIKFVCSASPSINNRPFTKAESLKVIEYLHSHDGNPPWHLVAKTLGTSRTPFQCFQHAQTKLSNTLREMGNPIIFLQDDDELLFKFIAASGPQFVINNNTATLMAQKIFPHVSHFQIIHRAHNSLINPQFVNEKWSESEERALVMGMKVYDESDNTPAKAAALLDGRSTKLVTDKWVRSMNPCYNTQPFTKAEDKALIAAVKKHKVGKANWNAVALKFPTRNPRWLQNRWLELAKREDVAKLKGDQLLNMKVRGLARRGLRSARNKRLGPDEEVLSTNDFAVRFSKKQRTQDD